jgi:hypothetical protein
MVKIEFDKSIDKKNESLIIENVNSLVHDLIEKNMFPIIIESIIITRNIDEFIALFNQKYYKNRERTKTKTGSGYALSLNYIEGGIEKSLLLIDSQLLSSPILFNSSLLYLIFNELSNIYIDENKFRFKKRDLTIDEGQNLDNTTEYLFTKWFSCFFAQNIINNTLVTDFEYKSLTFEDFILDFKRKIKKALFLCNSDKVDYKNNWAIVYGVFVEEIFILVKLYFDSGLQTEKIRKINSTIENKLITDIIDQIKINHDNIINQKEIDLTILKEHIFTFAKLNELEISQDLDHVSFHCFTNPKLLYNDVLVETDNRIVAFIDILGFKEMINNYDENKKSSTLLQDLNTTLKEVIDSTVKIWNSKESNYNFVGFDYKIFSDNICLSVPFFDSKTDFELNLGIVLNIVKNFQFQMLSKNYLIRGGISIGSYYSNDHLIFSGGLVDAYTLESKHANYPRVLIDEKIISKLSTTSNNKVLNNTIIFSKADQLYFVNPFLNAAETIEKIQDIKNYIDIDEIFSNDLETTDVIDFKKNWNQIFDSLEETFNNDINYDNTIPDLINKLESEFERNKIKESNNILTYRDRIRKRNLINKSLPSVKIGWFLNLLNWYYFDSENNNLFTKWC